MKKIVEKHPLAIRWFHWINFPILAIMIWSGLLIYWANDIYKIRIGGNTLIHFFPESFYKQLNIPYRLSEGMAFHFVFMWLFFGNGLLYVLYTTISGEWRFLVPNRQSFKEAWQILLHDLHLRKSAPPPAKYNGAQKIAYSAIIVMGLGSLLTGLAIYKPVQFYWLCALFGGYETSRMIHFILTIGYCLFFVIHIAQVLRAGWNNFRAMVAGFEVVKQQKKQLTTDQQVRRQIQRRTFLSFAGFLLLGGAAWKGWFWLKNQPGDQGLKGGVQEPLRKVLNANERAFQHALSPGHLAKTYPQSAALRHVRVNGDIGLDKTDFDPAKWTLDVTRANNRILSITLDQIKQLPKTEIVFDFKCIEGWSMITHWGGVKFSDFMKAFQLDAEAAMRYIGLMTPDQDYYVGIDMPSAMHPQTLLCYEMNGQPLTSDHGYPLRLIIPVKYGVKNLKRIGSLYFSDDRPDDYWFERGYDYFSGL